MKTSLLLINHDKNQLALWRNTLKNWGIPAWETRDAFTALEMLELQPVRIVVCRQDLPLLSGVELSRRIKKSAPGVKVALAAGEEPSEQVPSGRESSFWEIGPVLMDESNFLKTVGLLLLTDGLLLREDDYQRFLQGRGEYEEITGWSPAIQRVFSLITKVKDQEVTVLIQGESGTGKELIALAIHRQSARADKPFISVNCAALPESLLESELFGHEKGAFTGANSRVIGRFEQADRGCLFLDEIGDMSPATQAKVLRILEGQTFERVGGREEIEVDVRIIAATNRNLEQRVSEGKFRDDLFYRIGAFPILVPPLRERMEDLPLLVAHILIKYNRTAPRKIRSITLPALNKMLTYQWPGNIRHLENVIKRAAILAESGIIKEEHIIPERVKASRPAAESPGPPEPARGSEESEPGERKIRQLRSLNEVEKEAIEAALRYTGMNVSKAAQGLGISRVTLYKKARQYGIAIER